MGLLVSIEHHLNGTAYLSIDADHVHPFMTTVNSSCDNYITFRKIAGHITKLLSSKTVFLKMTGMFSCLVTRGCEEHYLFHTLQSEMCLNAVQLLNVVTYDLK